MSILFAKIFALYLFFVGGALIIRPDTFRKIYKKLGKADHFLLFGSAMAVLFGATVIAFHNVWVMDWPLLITLFGWLGILKGAVFICLPQAATRLAERADASDEWYRGAGTFWLVLGILLAFLGWG